VYTNKGVVILSLNTVSVFFPKNMKPEETRRSIDVIDKLLPETSFHISFYQSQEEEILEYIIQLPEKFFSHFNIHILNTKQYYTPTVVKALNFIESLGVTIIEHQLLTGDDGFANRKIFEQFISRILRNTNELLVFYNNDPKQISKLLLPITIAEIYNKRPYICKNNINNEIIPFERNLI
jgi:hypothetical protein